MYYNETYGGDKWLKILKQDSKPKDLTFGLNK
jgi:hypothetical protein